LRMVCKWGNVLAGRSTQAEPKQKDYQSSKTLTELTHNDNEDDDN
jgi:hypothetical protein